MAEKSRLAEILGLEEDEEYTVKDGNNIVYRIHNGERQYKVALDSWHTVYGDYGLTSLISNPSLIIRKPRFTDEEMTFLRLLHKYGKVYKIGRGNSGASCRTSNGSLVISNIGELLKPGESIYLDELFKEGENG